MIWLLLLALECPLTVTEGVATIYAEVIYAHEDPANPGWRYTYTTEAQVITEGHTAHLQAEGHPIGCEWYYQQPEFQKAKVLIKQCGDTRRVFPNIFADGFESGDVLKWSSTNGNL